MHKQSNQQANEYINRWDTHKHISSTEEIAVFRQDGREGLVPGRGGVDRDARRLRRALGRGAAPRKFSRPRAASRGLCGGRGEVRCGGVWGCGVWGLGGLRGLGA